MRHRRIRMRLKDYGHSEFKMTTITTQDGTVIKDGKVVLPTPTKPEDIEYYKRENREFIMFFVVLIGYLASFTVAVFFAYDWEVKTHYENHTVLMLRKDLK